MIHHRDDGDDLLGRAGDGRHAVDAGAARLALPMGRMPDRIADAAGRADIREAVHDERAALAGAIALIAPAVGAQTLGRLGHASEAGRIVDGDRREIDAGGDHGDADDALERRVESGAEDDIGVLVDLLTNAARRLVDFIERQVVATGDRDQKAAGTAHRHVVEQRVGDRGFGGLDGALVARGFAGAHHGTAHLAHDGADVGEVEVDEAFLGHQLGDRGDAGIEHLVGHGEGRGEGGLLIGHAEQVLVRNDDQRIDMLGQELDSALGRLLAAHAFEMEWLG